MKRDIKVLWEIYKGKHGNPFATEKTPIGIYGHEGEYFAMDDGQSGRKDDKSVIDHNIPPGQMTRSGDMDDFEKVYNTNEKRIKKLTCQPGLWCQWEVVDNGVDGCFLQWDGGEKFYEYIAWLKYLIDRFFEPWGVKLNGEIDWSGEENTDMGQIIVTNNVVKIKRAVTTFEDADE